MDHLLLIRGDVLALLEEARNQKWVSLRCFGTSLKRCNRKIKSGLEAGVDIMLPQDLPECRFLTILRSQGMERFAVIITVIKAINPISETFLKTLFIVSDVSITDEGSLGTASPDWLHLRTTQIPSN